MLDYSLSRFWDFQIFPVLFLDSSNSRCPVCGIVENSRVHLTGSILKTDPKIEGKRERFEKNQCIGITRGGRNSKIHAVVDALGNPIYVQLSSGDIHDSVIAKDVLDHVNLKPNETTVLADKAYGSYEFREYIANRNTDFCIPPKSNAVDPWYCDWFLYKERHLVECFFNKLKENRRIATRFDKLASRFLAFVYLGCIRIQLA